MDEGGRLDLDSIESIGHVIGIVAVIIGIAGIVLSIGLADEFSLRSDSLSDLGMAEAQVAWIFNGAAVISGFLLTIFFLSLVARMPNSYQRIAMALFGGCAGFTMGIGLFPGGHVLHVPMAIGFFVTLTIALLLAGYGDRLAGRKRRSTIGFNLALLHVVAWGFGYLTLDGLALPELVGVLIYGIWIIVLIIQRGRSLPY